MNEKILIIDDEPDIRFLLQDILQDEGYLVEAAENAEQAKVMLPTVSPDLVLLDIWMPDMDGVSLLKYWNESGQIHCPVVMMSGHGTVETAVEATRIGAFDFIEKPLSTSKLLLTVRSALNSQQGKNRAGQIERIEEPVGNSRQMQDLRQTLARIAAETTNVCLTGRSAPDCRMVAHYLMRLWGVRHIHEDINAMQMVLERNSGIYIHEVSELSREQQFQVLQRIANQSPGYMILASRHDYSELTAMASLIPELTGLWQQCIYVPSLNERIEDIPELVEYYVTRFSELDNLPYRHFGVAAQNMIRNHHWSFGLDEFRQFIRQILGSRSDEEVDLLEIQHLLDQQLQKPPSKNLLQLEIDLDLDMRQAREEFEREYLKKQLQLCQYNVSELSRKIGQERTNLYRKLKALGLQSKKINEL